MIVNRMDTELPSLKEDQYLADDLSRRCSVDIQGQALTSDILVALLDRPTEMRQLVSRNSQFYDSVGRYIIETQGESSWQRFQDILYKSREKLPDRIWMGRLGHYLAHNTVLLLKFKESVGYADDVPETSPPNFRLSTSNSTGSAAARRRSRRCSNFEDWTEDDSIIEEEAPEVPEGMFINEDQFYKSTRRRRSSCHDIQAEPHPTFVESKIDEVDEVEIENGETSDHLSDLLDNEDDSDNDSLDHQENLQIKNHRVPAPKEHDLIILRDHPDIQENMYKTHPAFFRKAKKLLSLAPSSRRFSATMRRNSIMQDEIPSSPITEMDEPRLQTCSDNEGEDESNSLVSLVCTTRRQNPDDIVWYNNVMEALVGWPELVDELNEIVNMALEENK